MIIEPLMFEFQAQLLYTPSDMISSSRRSITWALLLQVLVRENYVRG